MNRDSLFKTNEDIRAYLRENPFVLAPMVAQSDLPFRMLVRRYSVGLCYTPMINASVAARNPAYLKAIFATCPEDRPLVVQLAGFDKEALLKTAKKVIEHADIIDLNLGCPKNIAKKGNYGSFLLEQEDEVEEIVRYVSENLTIPFSCKIRLFTDIDRTIALAKKLEAAGCALLTVHGRTRFQTNLTVGAADWNAIKRVRKALKIPVILNGSIESLSHALEALRETGCDGVMSAEAILEYPALFSGPNHNRDALVEEYMESVRRFSDQHAFVKPHLFKLLYRKLQQNTDLRDRLGAATKLEEYEEIVREARQRLAIEAKEGQLEWYRRHWRVEEIAE